MAEVCGSGPHEQGLSLVELLVVGSLLAILVLTVLPQLSVPAQLDTELMARQVAADLGLARRLAIARRVNYVATFSPAGGPYASYSVGPQSGGAEPDFPKTFPSGVTVTGIDQITFAPSGNATLSGTITFNFAKSGATASVEIIAATGRVRVISP